VINPATTGPKATPIPDAELEEPEAPADWAAPEAPDAADPEAPDPDILADPVMLDMEPDMDMDPEEPEAMLEPEAPATVAMVPETPSDSRAIPFPTEV
jgi:hypothetical protein